MKMSAEILKRMFEDSHVTEDEAEFIEHVLSDLWECADARCLAVVLQDSLPPHQVRAQAARGLSQETVSSLAGFAPSGSGVVTDAWPAPLLADVPRDARYSVAALTSSHEQLTLISDGQSDLDTLVLVANILALAVERGEALRAARRLAELFNAGPVVLFRRRSTEGWPVDEVSPNVTREFGWSMEQLVGHPYAGLVFPPDLPRVREEVAAALDERRSSFAQKYQVVDGGQRVREVFELTHVIRDRLGNATHFHGYLFDDGERRRSEAQKAELLRQLQQSQKLLAIGTLASGVAHDFNNLLAVILTSLELATLEPGLAAHPDLLAAMRAAMKGRDMVRQLLVFGRSDEGRRSPQRIQHLIQDSLRLVRSILPRDVDLKVDLDPEAPPVFADPDQLRQLLINVVTNAVFAMPRGGVLEISLRSGRADTRVELEVKDTGTGMTPEVLARAFEPFFTTRPVGQGAGLGLAMVHAIARAHGGSVELRSAPGKGTTVLVSFPRAERAEEQAPQPHPATPRGTGRLAVVDDEPAVANSTERLISLFGYEVTKLTSARALLDLFAARPDAFDLVLTDQTMPEMTGLELGQALRARGVHVPVLLVTGLPTAIDPRGVAPPFAVLGKPYRAEELGRVLADLLNPIPLSPRDPAPGRQLQR